MNIKDWPVNERPRAQRLAHGAHSLSDTGLLAVLLGGCARRGRYAIAATPAVATPAHKPLPGCVRGVSAGYPVNRPAVHAQLGKPLKR
ncbi:MAG TPA: UPF0758 domain-containing protein [Steroidobacteraceae bacterium]|jgi:hypothetical protein